ncbi:MAG TPA: hypothetical protein VMD91_15295 [Candidatus Sulfotelmatobacter sp.]|nr:hypothetical protein [Candidatus Sulfotelmatobacter sp.]
MRSVKIPTMRALAVAAALAAAPSVAFAQTTIFTQDPPPKAVQQAAQRSATQPTAMKKKAPAKATTTAKARTAAKAARPASG